MNKTQTIKLFRKHINQCDFHCYTNPPMGLQAWVSVPAIELLQRLAKGMGVELDFLDAMREACLSCRDGFRKLAEYSVGQVEVFLGGDSLVIATLNGRIYIDTEPFGPWA